MLISPHTSNRNLMTKTMTADLVVVGGGLAGTCAAITAARAGIKVILVQDRPVLGGNASSEVRLWVLGATSHMGNNNRWAREGGVIGEILLENFWRNPEGNPLIFDTVVLEKTVSEPNITLLLNTSIHEVVKNGESISAVKGFNAQNSTAYELRAKLFCDASGDGVVGFLAGAAFRMGAETREEFDEGLAPSPEYGELLGHSIYFYSKDTGKPVKFHPPAYALTDITKIPRWRNIRSADHGCRFWWLEYGGRKDTIHDTEDIKWELWKVVYGVWNHIKNSGQFPNTENLTLEWVGTIPGKRESRRFEGPYMLCQRDVVEQKRFDDAVAFGGWSLDLHPSDGVYSPQSGCNQYHSRGVFEIPYRCLYSKNIPNLFLAGRIISVTHVAFSSTRVMGTSAHAAQAVGIAAALCKKYNKLPHDVCDVKLMQELHLELLRTGHHLPGRALIDPRDIAKEAVIQASSTYELKLLPIEGAAQTLDVPRAMLFPVKAGKMPTCSFWVNSSEAGEIACELRCSNRPDNYTPSEILATKKFPVMVGARQKITVDFNIEIQESRYVFLCIFGNKNMEVSSSDQRVTGILALECSGNEAVSTHGAQKAKEGSGIESIEFWTPQRRPNGRNLALEITPPLSAFSAAQIVNGIDRPTFAANAWVAEPSDPCPTLTLKWSAPRRISRVELWFDSDYDHPLESVLLGHPENASPFCVRQWRLKDGSGKVLGSCHEQHLSLAKVQFEQAHSTDRIILECLGTHGKAPAAIFAVRCYE